MDRGLLLVLGLFLVYAVFAVVHLLGKPGLPSEFRIMPLSSGIVSVDGVSVRTDDEVEFLLSTHRIGEQVRIIFDSAVGIEPAIVTVERYYDIWFILFDVGVSAVILGLGVVVALFHSDRSVASVFLNATIALATALLGTKTLYSVPPVWLGAALCGCFFLAYSMIPVLFLHFASVFPIPRFRDTRWVVRVLYAGTVAMAAWQSLVYLEAGRAHSVELFRRSVTASVWMNALMVAGIITGLVVLVGSFRRATTLSERKKAAWVLYGLSVGTLPFVLFWALPQTFENPPLIPEPLFKVFLLAIPGSFAIAILRYRLVDISTLISRSVVHAIVIGALLVLYALLIGVTVRVVSTWTVESSLLLSAAAAVLAAVAYDSIRRWAQRLVDRSFFRLSYDFRGSLKEVLEDLKTSRGLEEMTGRLVGGVEKLLPVDRIGYFTLEQPGNRLRTLAERNFPTLRSHGVRFEIDRLKTGLDIPVGVDEHIERTVRHESADAEVFGRWGISIAVPMKTRGGELQGFLVLGRKTSGLMFTEEDVDLLSVVAGQAAAENERINLHRYLLLERAEAERLEELSRLKSYFVSSVSHDLKTPLTSIRMFAEMLRSNRAMPAGTAGEYLKIIEGESERLTRLINNVLDFAKIERGIKEYSFRETDLNDIASKMMAVMQYQFRIEKCEASCEPAEGGLNFRADPDAILEAVLNLVANSLKYSGDQKRIRISTFAQEGKVGIAVEDNGIGIEPSELGAIFEPFHRIRNERSGSQGGAGLGLSVVKHVVDAHRGSIHIDSTPGKGSTFTMMFPAEPATTDEGDRT
ncbi:MAG TPA: ATP-binding protein [Bacteroidota bacterium]|nr:ATP-binding protein [Bacteroidota bacterium]